MWSPWKTHWGLALVKGIREPHEVKKEFFRARWESNPRPPELSRQHSRQSKGRSIPSNGRSNPEVVGSIPTKVKRIFSLHRVVLWFPLLGLTPSGSFMGFTKHFNLHFRVNSLFHHLCYAAQHSYVHLLSLRRDSPPKSSPIFSVRPRSSIDVIRRGFASHRGQKDFFFTSCGSLISLY